VKLIELSHTIEDGLVTYRGLPAPAICDFWTREASRVHYSPGTEFHIGRIDMVANTGTYVDSPFHRFANGADIAALPLEFLANLDAIVVRTEAHAVGVGDFDELDLRGKAVLIETGWSRNWGSDAYYDGHPFVTRAAADLLRARGAVFVGIDSYNIDDTADLDRPAHTILLGAGIPICEHMCNLSGLPDAGFRLTAAPPKVRGLGSFPVRAFATVEG
jgi:kynurenine formamidase